MMKNTLLIGALWAGLAVSTPALAEDAIEVASDNCFAAGQRLAAQHGATLLNAEAAEQGGQSGCKIVLHFEAQGGERPRREEVFVPD